MRVILEGVMGGGENEIGNKSLYSQFQFGILVGSLMCLKGYFTLQSTFAFAAMSGWLE